MPWIKAKLRGTTVYARATADGQFQTQSGRVEIRYNANDGRMYQAGAANLKSLGGPVLPDDTCGAAEAVKRATATKTSKGGKKSSKASAGPPPPPPEGTLVAYTDGACSGNPGPAGLGVSLSLPEGKLELSEFLGRATNNVAELTAILRALEAVSDPSLPLWIYTDSQYSIGVLTKGWKAKANQALIADIRTRLAQHEAVKLMYVKGHAGIEGNERADELARMAVETRSTTRIPAA